MLLKIIILNNCLFWLSVILIGNGTFNFLNYMISLEVAYLVIICSFCSIANVALYRVGGIFGLYLIGMAAAEAVIGFYFVTLLYMKKQTTAFDDLAQNKG